MMDFLSDVFEFEVDSISDSVQRGQLFFKLSEFESPTLSQAFAGETTHSNIVFSFKVKTEEELQEIMSKYNFFLYRKSILNSAEKLELIQNDQKKILTIFDIDQRVWRFELELNSRMDN
jgi:hypothetical protein